MEKIQINDNAISIREKFGVDEKSPVDIFTLLENQENFTTIFLPMSDGISGLCIRDGNNNIIAINSKLTKGRQQFTAAHELCHLFFHKDQECYVCEKDLTGKKDSKEKEADMFASYFMAPYGALKTYLQKCSVVNNGKPTLEDIIRCEQYYGLSHMALLVRLVQEQQITQAIYDEYLKIHPTAIAIKMGYSTDLYFDNTEGRKKYTIGKYVRLANLSNEKDLLANSKYEELLLEAFRDDIVYNNEGASDID